jgi:hypothetical protein
MKKVISGFLCFLLFLTVQAQTNRTDLLRDLEKNQPSTQNQQTIATLKYASRLFESKDDLTSVILIIPKDSVAGVLGSDSIYLKVGYGDFEGYIFRRDAIINIVQAKSAAPARPVEKQQVEQQAEQGQMSRFSYLENKYGSNMAARLAAGKIWKGMSAEMVRDSWGKPVKINRIIGDIVKEEWIYRNTWLYIENDILVEWGPISR